MPKPAPKRPNPVELKATSMNVRRRIAGILAHLQRDLEKLSEDEYPHYALWLSIAINNVLFDGEELRPK